VAALNRSPIRRRPADNHLSRDEWGQQFQRLLVRSGGDCEARTVQCLAPGGSVLGMPRERVSVQHRRAQGMGGTALSETHTLANQLIICGTGTTGCHGWIENEDRAAAELRGLWVRHTPVPVADYPLVLWSGRRVLLHPDQPIYLPHPDPWGLTELRPA
jgi:hypothetical protein